MRDGLPELLESARDSCRRARRCRGTSWRSPRTAARRLNSAEPVADRAGAAEEAVVGAADHERTARAPNPRHSRRRHPRQRVPQRRVDRRLGGRVVVRLDLDLVGEVAERLAQQRRRRPRPVWPGSVRMSTSSSTRSGITFVFVPPCDDRRRERRVRARVHDGATSPSGSSASASRKLLGVEQRLADLGRVAACPSTNWRHDVVDLGLGPVLGDAPHDLGRGDERVVGAERLRPVPGRAAAP